MTDECISPLRRRMIEGMTVRNFVVKTRTDYIRRVKNFAIYLGRAPDTATREDVRSYLLHLARAEWARERSTVLARRRTTLLPGSSSADCPF